uniref:Uncharacterized protein n=1 Tax=Anguilla anguilla TaxID=7936 RepID=A0A0E9XEH8_ANGAN
MQCYDRMMINFVVQLLFLAYYCCDNLKSIHKLFVQFFFSYLEP